MSDRQELAALVRELAETLREISPDAEQRAGNDLARDTGQQVGNQRLGSESECMDMARNNVCRRPCVYAHRYQKPGVKTEAVLGDRWALMLLLIAVAVLSFRFTLAWLQ